MPLSFCRLEGHHTACRGWRGAYTGTGCNCTGTQGHGAASRPCHPARHRGGHRAWQFHLHQQCRWAVPEGWLRWRTHGRMAWFNPPPAVPRCMFQERTNAQDRRFNAWLKTVRRPVVCWRRPVLQPDTGQQARSGFHRLLRLGGDLNQKSPTSTSQVDRAAAGGADAIGPLCPAIPLPLFSLPAISQVRPRPPVRPACLLSCAGIRPRCAHPAA